VGNSFAEELKRRREAMGLSRKEFGAEIDVSATTIQKWEDEGIFPKSSRWKRIKDFAGIDPALFRDYTGNVHSPTITASAVGSISVSTGQRATDTSIKCTLELSPPLTQDIVDALEGLPVIKKEK
jgi:hypothetical protein